METTTNIERPSQTEKKAGTTSDFQIGQAVVYGINGRCKIVGIEKMTVGGETKTYFKLEPQKLGPIQKTPKKQTSIWIPVETAKTRGLRTAATEEIATEVLEILKSKDTYFTLDEPFHKTQPQLDQIMIDEGAKGMAKAVSYIAGLKAKSNSIAPDAAKMYDAIYGVLIRELSEKLQMTLGQIELDIQKPLELKGTD